MRLNLAALAYHKLIKMQQQPPDKVILLDEGGAVLSSKFLKSVERVGAGLTYEFANYLVEIGEPRVSIGDDRQKVPLRQVESSSSPIIRKFISPKKDHNKSLHSDDQQKVPLRQFASSSNSNTRKFTTTTKDHNKKPLYNACQIIFILKKPLPEESFGPRKLPVEYASSLCLSDSIQMAKSTTLERNMSGTTFSNSTVLDNHKCDFQEPEVRVATEVVTSAMPCFSSKSTLNVPTTGITLVGENEESQPAQRYPTSSSNMSRTMEPETSAIESDIEYTGSGFADIAASATLPKSLDTETWPLLVTTQKSMAVSVLSGGCSSEVVGNASEIVPVKKEPGIFSNVEQCTDYSSCRTPKENFSVDGATGTGGDDISSIASWVQFFAETTDVEERKLAPSSGASLPVNTAADPSCVDLGYQGLSSRNLDIDSIPSFDLGF